VFVETVGIGQSDTDVVRVAHAVVVVLMPGLGDDVQASKAGLMEIGDLYVVNKADLPGADDMVVDLMAMARDSERSPPVLKVSSARNEGIEKVVEKLRAMREDFVTDPAKGKALKIKSAEGMIMEVARRRVVAGLEASSGTRVESLARKVVSHQLTIGEAADELLRARRGGR